MSEELTQDGTSTDQFEDEQEVDLDNLSAEELETYLKAKKAEVIKLNSIIERKGKIVKDLNEKVTDVSDDPQPIKSSPKSENEITKRLELKVDYGYPDQVIDHIMSIGGKEALSNPITKAVADKMAQDIKSQQATDIPDGPESSVDRRIKVSDLQNMSSEEMEKVLPHREI
jgi:hypothetical protein